MRKRIVGFVAVACVAVPMLVSPAGATRTAHSAKFVGNYKLFFRSDSGSPWEKNAQGMQLSGDGTGHASVFGVFWSNKGKVLTAKAAIGGVDDELIGSRTTRGIGSKKSPGYESYNGEQTTLQWYAVTIPAP